MAWAADQSRFPFGINGLENEKSGDRPQFSAPIAEFPNAWIKTKLNWARVRSRGLKRVAVEAIWPVLTYNLQRYFAITRAQTQTA